MRPIKVTLSETGSSPWVPMDRYLNPFNVGLGVIFGGTTGTATVEHTFDNVFDTNVVPTPFEHETLAGITDDQDGHYNYTVSAIRLTVEATNGPITLIIGQSGATG